jgi:hypothetical protein
MFSAFDYTLQTEGWLLTEQKYGFLYPATFMSNMSRTGRINITIGILVVVIGAAIVSLVGTGIVATVTGALLIMLGGCIVIAAINAT